MVRKNSYGGLLLPPDDKYRFLLDIFLVQIFLLCSLGSYAQSVLSRKIEWNSSVQHAYFNNAVFFETENMLPYFSETFRVENFFSLKDEMTLQLTDTKFEPFQISSLSSGQLGKIDEEIKVEQIDGLERGRFCSTLKILPLRLNGGQLERLVSFNIIVKRKAVPPVKKRGEASISASSPLASGNWIKVKIPESGVYKLTYSKLKEMGISNPERLRVFGSGGLLSLRNSDERPWGLIENLIYKGSDYFLFYAQGPNRWEWNEDAKMFLRQKHYYSEVSHYFLTDNVDTGKDNELKLSSKLTGANYTSTSYDVLRIHEKELKNLLKSGRQWFGEQFANQENQNFEFDFPELEVSAECKLQTVLAQSSKPTSSFTISNGQWSDVLVFDDVNYSYEAYRAVLGTLNSSFVWNGDRKMTLNFLFEKASPSAEAWLDYIAVNARAKLKYDGNQFVLRDVKSIGAGNLTQFEIQSTGALQVWELEDGFARSVVPGDLSAGRYSFVGSTETLKTYVTFSLDETFPEPEFVEQVANQNLHALQQATMVIVSHKDFLEQAHELAKIHREKDGLSVHVVDQQQVFNEFSSGTPDVAAIRDFVRMFYLRAGDNAALKPKYLLLLGDGSFDYLAKQGQAFSNTNFILTYQSENSLYTTRSFVSDDFFGLLDEEEGDTDGFLDIGIGRFPARTVAEAQTMVDKVKRYYDSSSLGDWRSRVVFVADDSEDTDKWYFMDQGEKLAATVWDEHPEFLPQKIYLDAYEQVSTTAKNTYPDASKALDEVVNDGSLLINYIGHGGVKSWADEGVLVSEQIDTWTNKDHLCVLLTATCEFSRFDNDDVMSAGEKTLYHSGGGAVGLFTTTRLVYAYPNALLNEAFFNYALKRINDEDNTINRLGDIMRRTKIAVGVDSNKRNFTLLGDPALALALPRNKVSTLAINDTKVTNANDTLRVMERVTISGQVETEQGQLLSNFNGIIYPIVYDRPNSQETRGNDYTPFPYKSYDSFIYKGKASVKNGKFSFSFVVPKDIRYQFGKGNLSFYASDGSIDASGAHDRLIIGGSSNSVIKDDEGPTVQLFFNDERFVSGDMTDETPVLIAKLNDESGINTLGSGIGHDIEAQVDEDDQKKYSLNGYYESDLDSYQSGKVEYKLPVQKLGEHTLRFKVWDVLNNSSEAEIDFVVQNSEDLKIERLFNYPNPFTDRTAFFFYHNRPYEDLEVLVRIYSVSGSVVKTIRQVVNSQGFLSSAIEWDGLDDFGGNIGRGVYFYQVRVATLQGGVVEKYEKLLLLK